MPQSPNQKLAITFGVVYLLIGVFGVAATDNATLFGDRGGYLFDLFEVNIFANAVHVLIGLGLIIGGASSAAAATRIGTILGVLLLVVGVIGFFVLDSEVNIIAANIATNVLHTVTGGVLLLTAIGVGRPAPKATA